MNNAVVDLQNISVLVPLMSREILNDINYRIYSNDFIVVLGSNGSGKSTLINLINQKILPTNGRINYSLSTRKKQYLDIMTLTQKVEESIFPNMSVLENYLLWNYKFNLLGKISSRKLTVNRLKLYLQKINSPLQEKLDTNISCLSGGERQALLLIMCVLLKPKLLLLDEHTSALDPKMAEIVISDTAKYVGKEKIPCMMTTHNIEHALNFGNRLLVLKNGKIVLDLADQEKQKLTKKDLISLYY